MKKKALLLFISLFATMVLSLLPAVSAQAYTWITYNGHEYALTAAHNTWSGAEAEAVGQGGHLVTINDAAEKDFLLASFPNIIPTGYPDNGWYSFFWIGLYTDSTNLSDLSSWKWSDGDSSTYWQSILYGYFGNYWGGSHAYLHTTGHVYPGTINNHSVWDSYGNVLGVIERNGSSSVPVPATMFLLAPALMGLAGLRRKFGK